MIKLTVKLLEPFFSIIKIEPDELVPTWVFSHDFYSITKTDDEISIVISQDVSTELARFRIIERDWRCFKILGPLDFSLIGILSKLSTMLAEAHISIFAISTYDTDYILVKESNAGKAAGIFLQHDILVI